MGIHTQREPYGNPNLGRGLNVNYDPESSRNSLCLERLRSVLEYEPESGVFRWAIQLNARGALGAVAGTVDRRGYRLIRIDKVMHAAHRLAWLYVHGRWPVPGVDHINGDKSDNRIANLREATAAQNLENIPLRKDNICGSPGVHKFRNKWVARIRYKGVVHRLGSYEDIDDAAFAYAEAKRALHRFQPTVRKRWSPTQQPKSP